LSSLLSSRLLRLIDDGAVTDDSARMDHPASRAPGKSKQTVPLLWPNLVNPLMRATQQTRPSTQKRHLREPATERGLGYSVPEPRISLMSYETHCRCCSRVSRASSKLLSPSARHVGRLHSSSAKASLAHFKKVPTLLLLARRICCWCGTDATAQSIAPNCSPAAYVSTPSHCRTLVKSWCPDSQQRPC
jgi:hypothetical protein